MSLLHREDGVSAVEFALVLPVLILLTMGMFAGGLAFHTLLSLDHAAREGARYGATLEVTNDDWAAYTDKVIAYTIESATRELDGGDPGAFVCVAWVSGDGTKVERKFVGAGTPEHGSRCYDDQRDEDRVQVLVRRHADFNAVFVRKDIPLRSSALARYERG